MTFEPPKVIDPTYLLEKYLFFLAEIENLFGELRNADDEKRLEIVSELLEVADTWIEESYDAIGIGAEERARAALIQMALIERLKQFMGREDDGWVPDLYEEDY